MEDTDDIIPENSLVFSTEQIEYLRSEFERQRKWVNVLSTRESATLEELELTKNSISYKVDRSLHGSLVRFCRRGEKRTEKMFILSMEFVL